LFESIFPFLFQRISSQEGHLVSVWGVGNGAVMNDGGLYLLDWMMGRICLRRLADHDHIGLRADYFMVELSTIDADGRIHDMVGFLYSAGSLEAVGLVHA
jgi:hypothetical protein